MVDEIMSRFRAAGITVPVPVHDRALVQAQGRQLQGEGDFTADVMAGCQANYDSYDVDGRLVKYTEENNIDAEVSSNVVVGDLAVSTEYTSVKTVTPDPTTYPTETPSRKTFIYFFSPTF